MFQVGQISQLMLENNHHSFSVYSMNTQKNTHDIMSSKNLHVPI